MWMIGTFAKLYVCLRKCVEVFQSCFMQQRNELMQQYLNAVTRGQQCSNPTAQNEFGTQLCKSSVSKVVRGSLGSSTMNQSDRPLTVNQFSNCPIYTQHKHNSISKCCNCRPTVAYCVLLFPYCIKRGRQIAS